MTPSKTLAAPQPLWEVLNGVGVDGVGVIFPFFYAVFRFFTHFFVFFRFSSLLSSSPEGQGQTTAIYCKNGEFHSDPVCTDPVQNLPTPEYCISFRKRRSFEVRGRGGIQEGRGRWGGGKKEGKKDAQKVLWTESLQNRCF